MTKRIVAPPEQDPIDYFNRWRRKPQWQRTDWKRGFRWGIIAVILFAGLALAVGIKIALLAAGGLFLAWSLLSLLNIL